MIDVELFYLGLLAWAALWPFYAAQRGLPILSEEVLPSPRSAEYVQQRYDRNCARRQIFRVALLCMAIYFPIRVLLADPVERSSLANLAPLAFDAIPVFLISFLTGLVARARREKLLAKKHPLLEDSLVSPWFRVVIFLSLAIPVSLIGMAIWYRQELEAVIPLCGLAVLCLFLQQRLILKLWLRNRVALSFDSPLGRAVEKTIEEFGFQPKRFVMVRSFMPNGFALKDGTVSITSTLRQLLTEQEIQAILAHELSHAKDGDAKRLHRIRQLFGGFLGACIGFEGFLLSSVGIPFGLIVPCCMTAIPTLSLALAWPLARISQKLEYKCDADAVRVGLGPQLATGLERLSLSLGAPLHWSRFERHFLTHPSTADRIARILASS